MKLQPPTSNAQHPTPNGAGRAASLDVGRSNQRSAGLRPGSLGNSVIVEPGRRPAFRSQHGSVLIIVLWIAIGLVSIALYFANSMHYELTASDNRMNGLAADQAIEGAARYVTFILQNFATNGAMPDNTQFKCAAVPVGDA